MENVTDSIDDEALNAVYIKTEIKQEYDDELNVPPEPDVIDVPFLLNVNRFKQELDTLESKLERPEYDLEQVNVLENETVEIKSEAPKVKRGRKKGTVFKSNEKKICLQCNADFQDTKTLKRHILGHTGARPFKCHLCESTFREKYNLSVHIKTHTGERDIPCPLCDKHFIVQSALTAHMRTHSKEKPYVCNICGKGFSHRANLKPHITTHSEEYPFMCTVCGKNFRFRKGLLRHIQGHHANCKDEGCLFCLRYMRTAKERVYKKTVEKVRECPICLKPFKYYTTYKNHLRMHNNENFCCNFCGKNYLDKAALRVHMRNHTGETPFECNVCGKKFKRRDSHRYHVSTHNKDRKLFTCDICNQGFTHKSSVLKHKKHVHETEKPFKCLYCERSFNSKQLLSSHHRFHTVAVEDRTYVSCRICGKTVEDRAFYAHMKRHGIQILKCRKCKSYVEGKEQYEVHQKSKCSVHGILAVKRNFETTTSDSTADATNVQDDNCTQAAKVEVKMEVS